MHEQEEKIRERVEGCTKERYTTTKSRFVTNHSWCFLAHSQDYLKNRGHVWGLYFARQSVMIEV
jgi:hypothetical protein